MAEDKHYFVGIKFKGTDKSYYFSTDMSDLKVRGPRRRGNGCRL
jgi:hypothetical protein